MASLATENLAHRTNTQEKPLPSAPPASSLQQPSSSTSSVNAANLSSYPSTSSSASQSTSSPSSSSSSTKTDQNQPTTNTTSADTTTTNKSTDKDSDSEDNKKDESIFECNICLDTAKDAVVSMCGHLFCWPCLHQWLETRPTRQLCPVCKAAISKEKVIPLYGRGSTNQQDPRTKVPPRPAGQRVEPEPQQGFQGLGFGDGGFHMSFGIGAFPFGFFTSSLNFGEVRPPTVSGGPAQFNEDQFLSKVFLWVTILFLAWLIFA